MEHTDEEKHVIAAFKAKRERHRESVIAAQKATPKEERERRKQKLLATNAAKREARAVRQERITNLVSELQAKMIENGD